jgi:hypothetical protein
VAGRTEKFSSEQCSGEISTMSVLERNVAESQDLITIHGKVKDGQPINIYNIAQLQKYHNFII